VEFDFPEMPWSVAARAKALQRAGYQLNKIDHWNFTFTRS